MADKSTIKFLGLYRRGIPALTLFLAGFFKTPRQNYHMSEKVSFDIVRNEEDIAIVITDLSTGARINADDLYTNKEMTPPVFDEEGTINSFDLIKRQAGQNPYDDPEVQATATTKAFGIMRKMENKIRRAIELMAAQILQTGMLTLRDKNGVALYSINFGAKATHFPTVGTAWNAPGANPRGDISALADVIRTDSGVNVDTAIMSTENFGLFMQNESFGNDLANRRFFVGEIAPEMRGNGATYQGWFWAGNYRVNIWTYAGTYKNPQTGLSTTYIDRDKVILLSATGTDLDLTFGGIPRIVPPDTRVLRYIPSRLPDSAGGMDFSTFAWVTPDGKQLKVSVGTRPLTVPTGIDTFGALDTGI